MWACVCGLHKMRLLIMFSNLFGLYYFSKSALCELAQSDACGK